MSKRGIAKAHRVSDRLCHQIDCSFISEKNLHELKIKDIFSAVKLGPGEVPDFTAENIYIYISFLARVTSYVR